MVEKHAKYKDGLEGAWAKSTKRTKMKIKILLDKSCFSTVEKIFNGQAVAVYAVVW